MSTLTLVLSAAASIAAGQCLLNLGRPTQEIGQKGLKATGEITNSANRASSEAVGGVMLIVGTGVGLLSTVSTIAGFALKFIGALFRGLGCGLLTSAALIAYGIAPPVPVITGLVMGVLVFIHA